MKNDIPQSLLELYPSTNQYFVDTFKSLVVETEPVGIGFEGRRARISMNSPLITNRYAAIDISSIDISSGGLSSYR